jgi:hypothetical protein
VLYSSENWTIEARDTRRITAAEIKYLRKMRDTLGQITQQTQGLQKNKIKPPVLDKIQEYRKNTGCNI